MFEKAIHDYLHARAYERIDLHTVLFDMDGVLFDSMKNHARSWQDAMAHFGMHMDYDEAFLYEGRTGTSTIKLVSKRERGREATDDEARTMYASKSELFNRCPTPEPMPGALQLVQQVKADGLLPIVVTGSGQHSLLNRVQQHFPDIFQPELMVTAFDVKQGKPNPEPYLIGLQKAHATPATAVVVENAPLGIQAGVAAGIFTIAVNTGPLPDAALLSAGANLLFPSMQALADAWPTLRQALMDTMLSSEADGEKPKKCSSLS